MTAFTYQTPEACGVPSNRIQAYLHSLEQAGLSTHSVIMARGYDIFFETYYPPFEADFLHRQYSDTKSWMSVAVGFAVQDGLVDLDAPIATYFPDECRYATDPAIGEQTVRQMLTMSVPKKNVNWFKQRSADRVADYFANTIVKKEEIGTFYYDSTGSFILGSMVERVTGEELFAYLRRKVLDRIGVSQEAHCLKCPGGHAWSDSALLAKPTDTLKLLRFLMNGGCWNGEQLLNEAYIRDATAKHIATEKEGGYSAFGYGYQIWRTYHNSFLFSGMGGQYGVCAPDKDMILVVNSDNQGIKQAGDTVVGGFFDLIYEAACEPLPANDAAYFALCRYADGLCLAHEKGAPTSPIVKRIHEKTYQLDNNPMKIRRLKLSFFGQRGLLEYKNASGQKALPFGICENCFAVFPEEGYSRAIGSVSVPGNYYKCAASAAWQSENTLLLNIQIIDEYFGRLWMRFTFCDDRITLKCTKATEDFLDEYVGEATGTLLL